MTGRSTNNLQLSIIIPVWNERPNLPCFLSQFDRCDWYELVVVDGGSTDGSQSYLEQQNEIRYYTSEKGRANQMNHGAAKARGPWLLFLHVDSKLPSTWQTLVQSCLGQQQVIACFRLRFDHDHPLLRLAAYGSRWPSLWFRGGDQGLLVRQCDFTAVGGYDPNFVVCEDLEIIRRLFQVCTLVVWPAALMSSARKFVKHGIVYTHFHFRILHALHYLGCSPSLLSRYYSRRFGNSQSIANQTIRRENC